MASLIALSACSTPEEGASPSASPTASASASPSGGEQSGSASPSASPSASESPSASPTPITPSTDLSAITVTDAEPPVVTVKSPWAIDKTQVKVLKPGTSQQKLTETSNALVNYVGVNGRTGEIFDSSWERGAPSPFDLQRVVKGFKTGLAGQSVGSRVLIAMPSEDGYGDTGAPPDILAGDSLIFVVDIISSNFDEATGEPVAPAAGLPTVEMKDGKPELTIPAGSEAPTELKVQPLVKGPGAAVKAESQIQVKFRSWNHADGTLLEDAWQPQAGPLANLIEGWKQGLVGQTAGSRVMLVIPPALAFPNGVPNATPSLAPGQTLVYVIDIMDVK